MKKNLITVIILAICIINLVFNILLVFVFMPSTTKTNKLITDIAQILDLEIAAQEAERAGEIDVSELDTVQLEQGSPINLKDDGTGVTHALQYGIAINFDKTAADYKKISEAIKTSNAMVFDISRDVIGGHTYAEVTDVKQQDIIKQEILQKLKETYNTECIYSVSFYNWVAQ